MTTPFDSFAAFRAEVVLLPPADAERMRTRLLAARLDPEHREQAAEGLALRPFGDGPAYTGYVWDYLVAKEIVTENEVWHRVDGKPTILAMWDIHSSHRVRKPDYFRFPKGTVLRAQPESVRRGLWYLPKDLYLFDETCDWAGALTHEWVDDARFCLWSGVQELSSA